MADKAEGCIAFAFALVMDVPIAIVSGALLAKMWEWFIADPFGAPYLSVVQAIGVSLTIGYLIHRTDTRPDDRGAVEIVGAALGGTIARLAITAVIALAVVQFR